MATNHAHRRFLELWAAATAAGLAAVAAFNTLVDPLGAHPRFHLATFEPWRCARIDRVAKAELARRGGWDTIILGSSRAEAGFPAEHPWLAGQRTCNLALDGARFAELAQVFEFARAHNRLRHVLLGLDFYMGCRGTEQHPDFLESRFNPARDRFGYACRQWVGGAATHDAWTTVQRWWRGVPPPPQERLGFIRRQIVPGYSQRLLFDQWLRLSCEAYRSQGPDPAFLAHLRAMVGACRDHGIDLQLAIMPVHALDVELLHAAGHWPRFEQWKSDIVRLLAEEGVEGRFGFWDFTGYAGPPAEPVPAPDDTRSRMRYYVENSHFTPEVGGLMLDTIFGGGATGFGVALTRQNLEAHLARIVADRQAFARQHQVELAWAGRVVAEVHRPTSP